jgi:hypothetical protein
VQWAGQSFPTAAWLNYDPIRPHDAFGQVMVENLKVSCETELKLNPCMSTGQHDHIARSLSCRPRLTTTVRPSPPRSGVAVISLAFTAALQWRHKWHALQKAGGRRHGARISVKYTPASQHKTCAGLCASRAIIGHE